MQILRSLCAVSIVILGLCFPAAYAADQSKGLQTLQKAFPVPKAKYFDGKQAIDLSEFKGKYVLLNFWATWCSPCLSEMPSLDRLSKKLQDKNILVIAISEDEGGVSQVRPFIQKLQLKSLKILYDSEKRGFKDFGLRGLPSTFLISPEGMVVANFEGSAVWDEGKIYNQIINILSVERK